MKKQGLLKAFVLAALNVLLVSAVLAQGIREYKSVPGDPLNVRIYELENGLKVYLSVYKNAPRIQTAIAVKTGSKNDPSDNTGLSHYLEHLMFKGTDKYGTLDWEKEKFYLDQIEALYEKHRTLTNPDERAAVYKLIDSLSYEASKYAIPNEYDKIVASLGAKGTNAYTSVEQTVYINDIPSNQLDRWLTLESERFRNPIFRLFHTELETVYEEKNMSLDNDSRKIWDALFASLYPTHTYGTQTTLGSQEHLKNPSLTTIRNYFNQKYVPNNMAIVMSGDFDPDEAIRLIDKHFGKLPRAKDPQFVPAVEKPIEKPIIKEVFGPDAENMYLAFRLPGAASAEQDVLQMMSSVLYNGTAGLIDLSINQAQKTLGSSAFVYTKKDYTSHIFSAKPKQGQSLEELTTLLLEQIERVKKGDFPDWLLKAIINEMKTRQVRMYENNSQRNSAMISAFVLDIPWENEVASFERLEKITKNDIVAFANKYYSDNYVVVYKRKGVDNNVVKVEKPQITPVVINRDQQSGFFASLNSIQVEPVSPVFLDYKKDIRITSIRSDLPLYYKQNEENKTFTLYYVFDMGKNHDPKLALAIDYLKYLGTSRYTPVQVKEELYKIGCSFNVFSSDDQVYVSLFGLSENLLEGIKFFEHLMSDAIANPQALENMKKDILKKRADSKLNKSNILWGGMFNYGIYGPNSSFTNIIPEEELMKVTPEELVSLIHQLNTYQHKVVFYGTHSEKEIIDILLANHRVPKSLKALPQEMKFEELNPTENTVYIVDYNMTQVEILMVAKSQAYAPEQMPVMNLFNEYFGSGMSSVVFQELREAKGLAYTAYAAYSTPSRPDRSHYIYSFIGTQNDKLPEAMAGMKNLLDKMPVSEKSFNTAKDAIIERLRTERITKTSILFNYLNAQKMGLDHDVRMDVYNTVPKLNFDDLKKFQDEHVANKAFTVLVLGKKDQLDLETLSKYGKIKFLSLEEIFGY